MQRKIPLHKVFMSEDILEPLNRTLMSGYVGQGPQVEVFEKMLGDFLGNRNVCTVNCATSGLHIALELAKMNSEGRDEVLTTPLTCLATNLPILSNGLKPRWVDVNDNLSMNVDDLRRKMSDKTLAIMVVHWGGMPSNLTKIEEAAEECYDLHGFRPLIIEDCAHAFGSKWDDKLLGNHGNICVFSFGAIKHLTTGDGGVIVTDDEFFCNRAKLLRWYGLKRDTPHYEQDVELVGHKFHMNDINAVIGIYNFSHVKNNISKHIENASYFDYELRRINDLQIVRPYDEAESSYWLYTVRVKRRKDFINKLCDAGIETGIVHSRNDTNECFHEFRSVLPDLDRIAEEHCCIPCGWWVTQEDRYRIVETIKKGW